MKLETIIRNFTNKILNEIFEEPSKILPNELNVYDFDDTLCKTDGTIHLLNKLTGERRELHPHEFHEYNPKEGEEFDLTDFGIIENPVVLPHFHRMKKDYNRLGPNGVSICTARPRADEIIEFMAQSGMPDIEVVAVGEEFPVGNIGNLNAQRKKDYLKSKIKNRNLKILRFFDDNVMNIQSAKQLMDEHPDIMIEIELVQ